MTKLYVPIREAADMVGVSEWTIRKWLHATEAPYLRGKKVGAKTVILTADLEALMQSLPDA
jgi:transposase